MRPGQHATGLLTAAETAEFFRVSQKTIGTWARDGKIRGFKTLGRANAHWRFREADIRAMTEPVQR